MHIAKLITAALMITTAATTASPGLATTVPTQEARTSTVTLEKGRLIEVAYFSLEPGTEKSVQEDYFPAALVEVAAEYGGRMLASFRVTGVFSGSMEPQMIGIFDWPDLATKARFEEDERFKAVVPIRDRAISFIKLAMYEVPEDTEVTFREDKSYEFFGAWLNPGKSEELGRYFQVSEPIKQSYGRPAPVFKASFSTASSAPQEAFSYRPHLAGIVEWDRATDYAKLTSSEAFVRDAAPIFASAISRIDLVHGQLVLD